MKRKGVVSRLYFHTLRNFPWQNSISSQQHPHTSYHRLISPVDKSNMQDYRRPSRMCLLQMLLFTAAPGASALLSSRSIIAHPVSSSFSTALFSETVLSPPDKLQTKTKIPGPNPSDDSTRKRLGKSSFLYKQLTGNNDEGTTASCSSAEELREMAEKHSGKSIGSSQYKKAWTRWLFLAVESIREDLGENLLHDHICDGDDGENVKEAFEKLFFNLGVAADEGTMPSFESDAARRGYALEFFCRGRALAEFLLETPSAEAASIPDNDGIYPEFWTEALRSPECPILAASNSGQNVPQSSETSTYEIVSLGGGPGFDFVGIAMAAAFSFHASDSSADAVPSPNIHVTAMDYEEGWSDLVSAMDQSTRKLLTPPIDDYSFPPSRLPAMSCDWGGKCDITKSILHEPVNANCKKLLSGGDSQAASKLWICQYCVAENAKALRASGYIFLKELMQEIPGGSMVLLTEVVPRLWPEIVRMLDKEGLLPMVDVGFRKGYCGKQFFLKKRSMGRPPNKNEEPNGPFVALDERTRDQLEHFERLASYHDRKVGSGWKRQGRKAR